MVPKYGKADFGLLTHRAGQGIGHADVLRRAKHVPRHAKHVLWHNRGVVTPAVGITSCSDIVRDNRSILIARVTIDIAATTRPAGGTQRSEE